MALDYAATTRAGNNRGAVPLLCARRPSVLSRLRLSVPERYRLGQRRRLGASLIWTRPARRFGL